MKTSWPGPRPAARLILLVCLFGAVGTAHAVPNPALCPVGMPPGSELHAVVMIGTSSGVSYWENLRDQLILCGWDPAKLLIVERFADICLIDEAAEIADEIDAWRAAEGVDEIDVVGYSLGGLRARAYIAHYGGWQHVRRLVTWGSPHRGLPYIGDVACWNNDAWQSSPYIECLAGTSADPGCTNPFKAAAPFAVSATEAGATGAGIVYTSFFGDDHWCAFCAIFGGGNNWPQSDVVVPGWHQQLAGAYNAEIPAVTHFDYYNGASAPGGVGFAETMLALLGEVPSIFDDGDGVPEPADNCPTIANASQADGDTDGLGDACDPCPAAPGGDFDTDGACDAADNCVAYPNADQADADGDGQGDVCDPCPTEPLDDPDGDGVCGPSQAFALLWNGTTDAVEMWRIDGATVEETISFGAIPSTWNYQGRGDFDGNGSPDFLFLDEVLNGLIVILMDGPAIVGANYAAVLPSEMSFVGIGDFDKDGKSDVAVFDDAADAVVVYFMDGTTIAGGTILIGLPADWSVRGFGDFDADGDSDALLFLDSLDVIVLMEVEGAAPASFAFLVSLAADQSIVETADFSGDGNDDILVWGATSRSMDVWTIAGGSIVAAPNLGTLGAGWTPVSTADFDSDGDPDLLIRDGATGALVVMTLDGTAPVSYDYLQSVASDWQVVATSNYP